MPVVFSTPVNVSSTLTLLKDEYANTYYHSPSPMQRQAWKGSLDALYQASQRLSVSFPIIAEYPIFDLERADFIVVGKRRVLVVEAKGWNSLRRVNDYSVEVGKKLMVDPCYQLENYVNKLRYFHSASDKFEFCGAVYTYGTNLYSDDCYVVSKPEELANMIEGLGEPGSQDEVNDIVNGKFTLTRNLVDLVRDHKQELLNRAAKTLLVRGYGLTEEQMSVVEDVLRILDDDKRAKFLVRGECGSGKTLVALTLLFEAISRGYRALLAYKNNRLLNTLRTALRMPGDRCGSPSALIVFYSTGAKAGFRGVGEPNFPADKYGPLDLVVYDEAQRMTEDVIRVSKDRARVVVYFYDDRQILIGDEAGTRANFLKHLDKPRKACLSAPIRMPRSYLLAVKSLLDGQNFSIDQYEFQLFDNITSFIDSLRTMRSNGFKVGLICAFTESEGDRKNPDSPKNLRLGYPLQSGLDLYRNVDISVKWLMDEKNQYPKYWLGSLDPLNYCSSVYGAQGFEADYVGVVWGRDLIYRGGWTVNHEPITDKVGSPSLKKLSTHNPTLALELLKNRYYIMLTRGIRGTYVFFEDQQTREYVKKLLV
ncbi:MAG: DNA/RNA helicase domain-containing protein [Thermoprotei archaeon]